MLNTVLYVVVEAMLLVYQLNCIGPSYPCVCIVKWRYCSKRGNDNLNLGHCKIVVLHFVYVFL